MLKIKLCSIPVQDQTHALAIYTDVLGFRKKQDIPMSADARWLTVVSPHNDEIELLLEPAPGHFEPSAVYQKALFDAGIPYTQFYVDNLQSVYEELRSQLRFTSEPKDMGAFKYAMFDDTCGNLIQIVELTES